MTHLQGSEKNLTYLKDLEKHKAESEIIHKLNVGGNTTVDQNEIIDEQKGYYQSLYQNRTRTESSYTFYDHEIPQLSEIEKTTM